MDFATKNLPTSISRFSTVALSKSTMSWLKAVMKRIEITACRG
jgi:hypothetical protein